MGNLQKSTHPDRCTSEKTTVFQQYKYYTLTGKFTYKLSIIGVDVHGRWDFEYTGMDLIRWYIGGQATKACSVYRTALRSQLIKIARCILQIHTHTPPTTFWAKTVKMLYVHDLKNSVNSYNPINWIQPQLILYPLTFGKTAIFTLAESNKGIYGVQE